MQLPIKVLSLRFMLFGSISLTYMGFVFIYSIFLSPPNLLDTPGDLFSFLTHFTAYFALSLLVYETFRSSPWNLAPITRWSLALICAFLYSMLLEFLQLLTQLRQFEAIDIAANFLGAFLGACVMVALREMQGISTLVNKTEEVKLRGRSTNSR